MTEEADSFLPFESKIFQLVICLTLVSVVFIFLFFFFTQAGMLSSFRHMLSSHEPILNYFPCKVVSSSSMESKADINTNGS